MTQRQTIFQNRLFFFQTLVVIGSFQFMSCIEMGIPSSWVVVLVLPKRGLLRLISWLIELVLSSQSIPSLQAMNAPSTLTSIVHMQWLSLWIISMMVVVKSVMKSCGRGISGMRNMIKMSNWYLVLGLGYQFNTLK